MKSSWIKYTPYIFVVAIFVTLSFVFGFNGLYGQDPHEYLRYSQALVDSHFNSAGDFHWPKLYPAIGALLGHLGIPVLIALQSISLLACLGILWFAQKSINLIHKSNGTWLLLLGSASEVYFVRSGMIIMSDVLCAFWIMGAFYWYLKSIRNIHFKYLLLLILFAILAIFTRYAAIPLMAPILIHILVKSLITSNFWRKLVILGAIVGLALFVFCTNDQILSQITDRFNEWNFSNLFNITHHRKGRLETNWVPNVLYIFSNFAHLGFLSFGILLLIWIRKWSWIYIEMWIAIFVYLIFIGGLEIQNQRFMVITHLPVLVLIYPAFKELWDWLQSRKLTVIFVVGVLVFNTAFFYYSFSKTYKAHRLEKEVVEAIKSIRTDEKVTIYSFYVDQSFPSYGIDNPVKNMWMMEKPDFERGALVVFNPELFEKTWKDHQLMKNWTYLNGNYTLEVLLTLRNNWKIYRIK